MIIGLTGGMGCGKSTVCQLFAARGVPIIDADVIAHRLSLPGQAMYAAITEGLGEHYLHSDGQLNRGKLRDAIFKEPALRERLEQLTHPLIREAMLQQCQAFRDAPYTIFAIPLLLEKNWTDIVDRVLVVDCARSQQLERVMARDRLTRDEVEAILATQLDRDRRLARADDVIENTGSENTLEDQVGRLHQRYLDLARR